MRVDELEALLHESIESQPPIDTPRELVVRRVRRRRARRRAGSGVLAVGLVAVLLVVWSPWSSPRQRITATSPPTTVAPARFGQSIVVHGVAVRLAKSAGAQLPGNAFSAPAVPTPDGASVYYAADAATGPEIRMIAVASGDDVPLISDAYSPTLDVTGTRLAYGHAAFGAKSSELRVRDLRTSTEQSLGVFDGIIQPIVWAGSTLVSQRFQDGLDPRLDVELSFPSGTTQELRRHSFKAVSDDGALVLVVGFSGDKFFEVLDARTGESKGAMTLGQYIDGYIPPDQAANLPRDHLPNIDAGEESLPVAPTDNPGVWSGSEIVLPANPNPILIRVQGATPLADGLLALPAHEGEYIETMHASASGHVLVPLYSNSPLSTSGYDCDVAARTCVAQPIVRNEPEWSPLVNPSR